MTETELRQLDAEIAEKIDGLTLRHFSSGYGSVAMDSGGIRSESSCRFCGQVISGQDLALWQERCIHAAPPYSSDISAAMKVEDRIAELGLTSVYVQNLWGFAAEAATRDGRVVSQFDIVHASAEQRCRAALKAIENVG